MIDRMFDEEACPQILTKMNMLINGISTCKDPRCYEITNYVIEKLQKMLESKGHEIELVTLDNALVSLCFEAHPT